jgi:acyl-CoA dehydrogenase
MGADVTYPVHRYFLLGKQIELMCGAASSLLATLGDALADRPLAGDAVHL